MEAALSSKSRTLLLCSYQLVRPVMVDHTTRKTTTDRLENAISHLTIHHDSLSDRHADLANKVDSIMDRLNQLTTLLTPPPTQHPPPQPPVKLEVPRLDNHDPIGWIFKISQFFYYQRTPDEEHIIVVSFYMDGPTLSWYQWMFRNGFITS